MKLRILTALGLVVIICGIAVAEQDSNGLPTPPAQGIAAPLDLTPFEIKEYCFDVHSDPPIARAARFVRFASPDYWNAEVFVLTITQGDNIQLIEQYIQGARGYIAMFFEKRDDTVIVRTKDEFTKRLSELLPPDYFDSKGQLETKNFSKCSPNQPA